jgi:glucose/arabinose dehydrogenase
MPKPLEPRLLLAADLGAAVSIRIDAAGQTGQENLALKLDGQVVAQWASIGGDADTRQFESLTYEVPAGRSFETVEVAFTNDLYQPGVIDRNLIIDQIQIGDDVLATESPLVRSTGTWQDGLGFVPGFYQTETLHGNGEFQFQRPTTSITVFAVGQTGSETMELLVDGQTAGRWENIGGSVAERDFQRFGIEVNGTISADRVRVAFTNDLYQPGVIDRNLVVDRINIDGTVYQSESEATYSNGTWNSLDNAIIPGRAQSEFLHSNGFFQFQGLVANSDFFSIAEDSPLVPLAVDVNDFSSNDGVGQLLPVSDPLNGTVAVVDNVLFYQPNPDFVGSDSFTYYVASIDGSQPSLPTAVVVTVNESHQQPQSLINPAVASELTPSGRALVVEKWGKLPLGENGRQPRMNSMATLGERVFIVTDGSIDGEGRIYEMVTDSAGSVSAELFFDVGAAIFNASGLNIDNSSPLNGLRSVAFHPEFSTNGKFFTSFTGQRPENASSLFYLSDPEQPVAIESVLVEWTFDFANQQVDPQSYREVFRVGMRNSEHSIRDLRFNPFATPGDEDYGLLYIGHGDGSEQSAISGDGQSNDALGKILRIDPLASGDRPLTTPESNPFVGDQTMIDEAFAIGFRNPHNLSFARDASGTVRLIVADVGRDNIEEINIVTKGANYGWADREGVFVHERDQFEINGNISNLPFDEASNGLTYPVTLLGHEGVPGQTFVGQAIAGGMVVQNGSSELDDQIIFVEFGTDGRAYHVDFSEALEQVTQLDPTDPQRDQPSDLTWLTPQELVILFDHDNDETTTALVRNSLKDVLDDEPDFERVPSVGGLRADLRLGQGPSGELYVMNKRNGWVYRVTNTTV